MRTDTLPKTKALSCYKNAFIILACPKSWIKTLFGGCTTQVLHHTLYIGTQLTMPSTSREHFVALKPGTEGSSRNCYANSLRNHV